MNEKRARRILRLTRPGAPRRGQVQRAVEFAAGNDALRAEFEAAEAFDRSALRAVAPLAPNPDEQAALAGALDKLAHSARHFRFSPTDPGFLAVTLALLIMVGFGIWHFTRDVSMEESAFAIEAVLTKGVTATGEEFEPVEARVGELDDWFVMNGIPGYRVPEAFENLQTIAARIFLVDDTPVGCLAVPDNRLLLFVFEARPLGVRLRPENAWHVYQSGGFSGAAIESRGICFMVAMEGSDDELWNVLDSLGAAR